MKSVWFSLLVLVAPLAMLGGCAPKATPVPLPTAAAPQAPTPLPTPTVSTTSPEDAAWAKVIEAAKKEGRVTLYGSSIYAGDVPRALRDAFYNRYGITLEVLQTTGRVSLEKVKVEQQIKKPIADLVGGGLSVGYDLVIPGLTVKVADELPELKKRDAFLYDVVDMDGHLLNLSFNQTDLLINTKLVKPEDEPKSYYDLLAPKLKGQKMLIKDPRAGGSSTWQWFSTSTFHKALDYDYFRRIMSQEPFFSSPSTSTAYEATMVARGEVLMMVTSVDSVAYMVVEGAPFKFLALPEGSWSVANVQVLIKNSPHPNAAKLFTNWLFTQEGQTIHNKARSGTPIRKDVPDFILAGVRPEPKKTFVRTIEVMEASSNLLKTGIVNEIFTPK